MSRASTSFMPQAKTWMAGTSPAMTPVRGSTERTMPSASHGGQDDFAVLDLDEVDARGALAAFLTGGAGFLEIDLAVHAGGVDLPERRTDRLRLRPSRPCNGGRNRAAAVLAPGALRRPRGRRAALLPFLDERLRHRRIG